MNLDDYMRMYAISNATLASQIGVTREMVRRYREGLAAPGPIVERKIFSVCDSNLKYINEKQRANNAS